MNNDGRGVVAVVLSPSSGAYCGIAYIRRCRCRAERVLRSVEVLASLGALIEPPGQPWLSCSVGDLLFHVDPRGRLEAARSLERGGFGTGDACARPISKRALRSRNGRSTGVTGADISIHSWKSGLCEAVFAQTLGPLPPLSGVPRAFVRPLEGAHQNWPPDVQRTALDRHRVSQEGHCEPWRLPSALQRDVVLPGASRCFFVSLYIYGLKTGHSRAVALRGLMSSVYGPALLKPPTVEDCGRQPWGGKLGRGSCLPARAL